MVNDLFGFSSRQLKALALVAGFSALLVVYVLIDRYTKSPQDVEGLTIYVGGDNQTYRPVFQVNLNTAPADSLELIPGIGPVYSERIVAYRDSTGGFAEASDITRVRGIGVKLYERIKPYLYVE